MKTFILTNKKLLLVIFISIFIGWVVIYLSKYVAHVYRLGINTTNSEIRGLYACLMLPSMIKHNDMIAFELPNINWLQNANYLLPHHKLIKHVGALPGAYLFTRNRTIYSCENATFGLHCKKLGKCLPVDSKGKKIPCQHWEAYRIPENNFYMQSSRQRNALDSRYLGLISRTEMKYQVFLLWGFDLFKERKAA